MYKIKQKPEDFIVEEVDKIKKAKHGNYVYYLLTKENWDTFKAIQKIASKLNIKQKLIGFAGNKDKYALTKQYISLYKINKKFIDNLRIKDINLKFVGYGHERINLGDLEGNKFTITVRNLEKKISMSNKLFLENYFDDQRFGVNKNTHLVGRAIIKRDFKEACKLLSLNAENNNFIGALRKQPRRLLRFYISSYQSYLFNKALSYYITKNSKDTFKVKYSVGTFVFSKDKIKDIKLPLLSFDTEFKNEEIEEAYNKIMLEENIELKDFILKQMPELISETSYRSGIIEIKNVKSRMENDESNKGKYKLMLEFKLPKGAYATLLIKKYINE